MLTVKINIQAAEWEFQEELPFSIESIKEKEGDFQLPLYNEEGEETESVTLTNCHILLLEGEDDLFQVVVEKSMLRSTEQINPDENYIEINIALNIDQPIWKAGEDIGIFYPEHALPATLRNFELKTSGE